MCGFERLNWFGASESEGLEVLDRRLSALARSFSRKSPRLCRYEARIHSPGWCMPTPYTSPKHPPDRSPIGESTVHCCISGISAGPSPLLLAAWPPRARTKRHLIKSLVERVG